MELFGYSLWLQPEGDVYERFTALIKDLAVTYNGPLFQPHVTLLGILPDSDENVVLQKTTQLARERHEFTIHLTRISYQEAYFRTLFVLAEETRELIDLHTKAKELFGMHEEPPFMPHLSLLYGTFPHDVKETIIQEIGQDQHASFPIKKITVVHSSGLEHTWKVISSVPFGNLV